MNELRHYKTVRLLGKNSNFSMMREERLSNFELLRILAMFMIVAHHFVVHSGLNLTNELLSVNGIWMQLLMVGGKIGVNIFVLISGYFLIESSRLNYIKLIKFWLQVFFYSVFFFLITLLYQMLYIHTTVSISDIIHVLFPLSFEQWWFASVYFVLFLLSPFLNRLLKSINQKSFFGLLFMMFVIWSVIPSILLCDYLKNELIWFVFCTV